VIETTAALRGEFLGLEPWEPPPGESTTRLPKLVTIDGLSGAGKTTLARMLGARFGCKVIDSGLVFRTLARAGTAGNAPPDDAALDDACLAAEPDRALFDAAVTANAGEWAANPAARTRYESALSRMLRRHAPCVVVGRDTWKIVDGKLYLNYNQKAKDAWEAEQDKFIKEGEKNWKEFQSKKPEHKGQK